MEAGDAQVYAIERMAELDNELDNLKDWCNKYQIFNRRIPFIEMRRREAERDYVHATNCVAMYAECLARLLNESKQV